MPHDKQPELIAQTNIVSGDGNESCEGSSIVSVAVYQDKDSQRRGEVQLVVHDYNGDADDLIVRLPLPELMAALGLATLNAERDLT